MAGKADVQTHLNNQREANSALFNQWGATDLTPDDRAGLLERYFKASDLGEVRRIGASTSLHVASPLADPKRPNVLVVGRHDIADLVASTRRATAEASISGPGTATRIAPTVAFAEGFLAARAVTRDDPINISFLSLGEDDDYADVAPALFTGNLEAVFVTNAVCWSPHHPTLTTGARGQILAQLTLDVGAPINDYLVSGALRNPLSKMTQLLGELRDNNGRIALDGFYERAHAPDTGMRAALADTGHDPDEWASHLGIAKPGGRLSALERAALWPGVSVLAITTDTNDGVTAPASTTATIALYLVPDQRHAEVERALRDWFASRVPDDLHPSVRLISSTRPYRSAPDSGPVAAQARAAFRLYGRHPVLVPAGGPAGSGEIAFATGRPVGFAGIARPSTSLGTHAEDLPWSQFDAGVAMAAETCLQLRRG